MNKYLAQYREFEKGKYGFMADIAMFMIITYFFHLLYRYYAVQITSIPLILNSGEHLAYIVYAISLWFNENILGMDIVTSPGNFMEFKNGYAIYINFGCSGLKQFYQVIVLFVLFPGPWRHKFWFIPFSCLVMFMTNIFRVVVLSVIQSWRPEYFEFTHTWILRPFFYVVLFGLWILWVEKFKNRSIKN